MTGLKALRIAGDSVTTAVSTGSEIAVPDKANGTRASYVLLTVLESDASSVGFIPIQTGATPAITTMARVSRYYPLVVDVGGNSHLRAIAVTGTVNLTVSPLENQ